MKRCLRVGFVPYDDIRQASVMQTSVMDQVSGLAPINQFSNSAMEIVFEDTNQDSMKNGISQVVSYINRIERMTWEPNVFYCYNDEGLGGGSSNMEYISLNKENDAKKVIEAIFSKGGYDVKGSLNSKFIIWAIVITIGVFIALNN